MADELDLGPVDYFLVGFPPGAPLDGGALAQMAALVDAGVIEVLDALVIRKDADGTISGINLAEMGPVADVAAFEGVRPGLLGDDDMAIAAEEMPPGSVAAFVLYENTWARGFVTAVHERGGVFLGSGRIGMDDLLAAIEAAGD
ncbi:MAG: DUF1269 domain-containing protein [Actinobacteria bacterium]|nr:DUF1269 domain-containing protein [Actinomycetota bacterium]